MPHVTSIEDILKIYETSQTGLSLEEAKKRLEKHGENKLKIKKPTPLWIQFLEEFKDLMVIILISAGILAGVLGKAVDCIAILIIVALNTVISFAQKYKAEKAIEALKKLVSPRAIVIRNDEQMEIDAKEVTVGDIIILAEGAHVPADARLIEEHELKMQESILTGESMPVKKQLEALDEKHIVAGEHSNRVFMGTVVAHGTGKAVVTHIGMGTEFGKIANLTVTTKQDKSPLQKELARIGIFVGKLTLIISVVFILVGIFIQGKQFLDTILFAVSVAVAAVPEGLPATITIALAIGVQRLASKKAIIKQLASVETLGGVTVICSDKTGTLTKNEMTVQEIAVSNYDIAVHGVGYEPKGAIHIRDTETNMCITIGKPGIEDYEHRSITLKRLEITQNKAFKALELISRTAILCNNAHLSNKKDKWEIIGDPTEGALLVAAEKAGLNIKNVKEKHKFLYEIPFDSDRKLMSTIHQDTDTKKIFAYVKGAPDAILEKCSHIYLNGRVTKLDKKTLRDTLEKNEELAKQALRILAFAYSELDPQPKEFYESRDVEKNLIFIGMMGMIDPPREEAIEAVKLTHKAGIKTYIVTGDNGSTAHAIAQKLGITGAYNVSIITGADLNQTSDAKLEQILKEKKEIIFARVSPEHKLKIVTALKNIGERVAVTGDGVNDAPALKKADIGIAMGLIGTDVSREAANMILADDSYATIVKAIQEGRAIYQNLKKFIFYTFSCNIGELITVISAIILNIPAPLTAILILVVNLGTDVLPALALGVDPPDKNIMDEKPRDPNTAIMNRKFIWHFVYIGGFIGIIVVSTYLWTLLRLGWHFGQPLFSDSYIYLKASTVAFALLIIIQMINAFNARSPHHSILKTKLFSNLYLLGAIAISIISLLIFIEVPVIQTFLHTAHLSLYEWGYIVLISFSILVIEEIRKIIAYHVSTHKSNS